jgi:transketolase
VKGKGISFMEDVAKWHHGVPTAEEYEKASAELESALARLGGRQ